MTYARAMRPTPAPTHDMPATMRQTAPYPTALADVVNRAIPPHKGWRYELRDEARDVDGERRELAGGLTLYIYVEGQDAYHPEVFRPIRHSFVVPAATYDEHDWTGWLFRRCADVVMHELGELFAIAPEGQLGEDVTDGSGVRPFAPHHQPGRDPYFVREMGTWEEADRDNQGRRNHLPVST